MLDPSLLLSPPTARVVWEAGSTMPEPIFLPSTFLDFVQRDHFAQQVGQGRLSFFGSSDVAGFGQEENREPLTELIRSFGSSAYVKPWSVPRDANVLDIQVEDGLLRGILLEEWTFLQHQSWLASLVRRPFDAFISGGAAAIEVGRTAFDRLAARTLKLPRVEDVPLSLGKGQRLRAVTKWAAVAVPIAAGSPWWIDLAGGFFLLFDP